MMRSSRPASAFAEPEVLFYELGYFGKREVVCRLLFPGDAHSRGASLGSKWKLERLLTQPFLKAVDRKILMGFYMGSGAGDRNLPLRGGQGFRLICDMVASGRCVWEGALKPLKWTENPAEGRLAWRAAGPNEGQEPVVELDKGNRLILVFPLLAVNPAERWIGELAAGVPPELAAKWASAAPMRPGELARFLEEVVGTWPDAEIPAPAALVRRKMRSVIPQPVLDLCPGEYPAKHGAGAPARLHVGQVGFSYLGVKVAFGGGGQFAPAMVGGDLVEIERDRTVEGGHWSHLESLGLVPIERALPGFDTSGSSAELAVPSEMGSGWETFLAQHGAELREKGWDLRYEGRATLELVDAQSTYVHVNPGTGGSGWFEFETGVQIGDKRVNLLPIIHDLLRRYSGRTAEEFRKEVESRTFFVPTVAGVVHAFPGSFFVRIVERIFELYDREPFAQEGKLRLSGLRAMELVEQFGAGGEVEGLPEFIRRAAAVLREGIVIEPMTEPPGLAAKLRDYQRHGLGWLQFMATHQLNGVLADDMGLGKTLQTIAHLLKEKEAGRLDKAALLVAPTSLMRNWQREVGKFAPDLKVITLHGENRQAQFRAIPAADLVLTTYGLIRRDESWHREQTYSWVIVDEAQFIKNPDSRSAKVLGSLRCERRLCLTGTPVENHLGELWSLFHFLMPGFLGEREAFRRQFRVPIEEEGNEAMRQVLNRRVRPFLLRRRKNEVATELPPKTEIEHPVEMTERQWEIYETVRVAVNQKIMKEIALHGVRRSQIVILDALTKLRQICCDPRLAKIQGEELKPEDSGKLMELMEILPDMVSEGRRVLVFSQFTSMLKLIEEELDRIKMGYVKLTGSTVDRAKVVDRFQSGKVPVFLISLRAGGTGLNLTQADTVIHYDPWWNPQVENQATDRAYRIGQENPVFAYKLVAEDSVEERIVAMQKRKAELAEGILTGQGGKLEFGEEEVAALLR